MLLVRTVSSHLPGLNWNLCMATPTLARKKLPRRIRNRYRGRREGNIEFRPEFALRSIAARISTWPTAVELEVLYHASRSVALPTRRLADNNNSFPPKRALIMVRARARAGKPAKRSFVETTRASIAMSKQNRRRPSLDGNCCAAFLADDLNR